MGGKRRSSSSVKSFFSIFFRFSGTAEGRRRRHMAGRRFEAADEFPEPCRGSGRVWRSDEDRGWWVADPDIDFKTTEFIINFHKNRVATELGRQTADAEGTPVVVN